MKPDWRIDLSVFSRVPTETCANKETPENTIAINNFVFMPALLSID
jgi:hypothetical protein